VSSNAAFIWVVDEETDPEGLYGQGKYAQSVYKVGGATGALTDVKRHYYALKKIWPIPMMGDAE
jgi:hypothetical protein